MSNKVRCVAGSLVVVLLSVLSLTGCQQILNIIGLTHTLTVTVSPSGSGTVTRSPDQSYYPDGTRVQLSATPESGWLFSRWEVDLTGSANPANVLMDASKLVTAVFVQSASSTKALTSFGFVSPAVTGTINESAHTVAAAVPYGTAVSSLVAVFTTTGSQVRVGSTVQVSGTTANSFSSPVTYTVVAADGSTQDYVVSVTVSASGAKALTSFGFASPAAAGTINESSHTVAVTVPYGTNLTNLVAVFTTTGSQVRVGSTVQVSGATPNNFSTPVTYTVVAADGSTQDYVVTVTVSPSSTKALTSFGFVSPAVTGTINESAHTVAVAVPYGTDVTNLVAQFTTTGSLVRVGSTVQVSGATPNNFSSAVTYTVVAGDGSTQDYVVTVTVSPSSTKALTSFGFVSPAVTGTINEGSHTVAVTVPSGTTVTSLVAVFTTTGSQVRVGGTVQVSGTTANNFSNPVTYTVVAADSSTQDYVVTVTVAPSSQKALTSFGFASPAVTGTINESAHTVAATVPYGTAVTSLVAVFTTTGSQVRVGSTVQVSGVTANNFSSPVTYTVVAADGSTQDYVVTVTVAPSSQKALTSFGFVSPAVTGTINESAHTVAVTVSYGTNLTNLVAVFTTTGSQVRVGSTVQVSGTTANDFTNPVTYTVVAADGSTQDYVATITVAPSSQKALTSFGFVSPSVTGTITESTHTVTVTVPGGTNTTALVAVFTSTGSLVRVGSTVQISGSTANDFGSAVTYTVVAADGTTQDYVVTVTQSVHSVGAWSTTTSLLHVNYDNSTVLYNGRIYVIAGGNSQYRDVMYAAVNADGSLGPWQTTTALSANRADHRSVVYNGYVYVVGGWTGSYINLNDVLYAKVNTDGSLGPWNTTEPFPIARYRHECVAYNGCMYLIGGSYQVGTTQYAVSDVEIAPINADGSLGQWVAGPALPTPRCWISSAVANGYVYVFGGSGDSVVLDEVLSARVNVDGTLDGWVPRTALPNPVSAHASAFCSGCVYVTGGVVADGESYSATNKVFYAQLNADGTVGAWEETTPFTAVRQAHTAVATDTHLYVLGGYDGTSARAEVFHAPFVP